MRVSHVSEPTLAMTASNRIIQVEITSIKSITQFQGFHTKRSLIKFGNILQSVVRRYKFPPT